jgi:DNA-binding response OmpR family regulator
MKKKILVIEDEPAISMAVQDELEFEGFAVEVVENGQAGLRRILEDAPDLVILDLMLPGKSGFEICRDVRERGLRTPIIVLTARTQEADRVRGLDLGADDYVVKPFSLAELLARVRAVLRRSARQEEEESNLDVLQTGNVRADLKKRKVTKGEDEVKLTPIEFQLLECLLRKPGEVISRDEFLGQVWGQEVYVTHRAVDTHMAGLRRKIEDDLSEPHIILSVRGVGYKLNEDITET